MSISRRFERKPIVFLVLMSMLALLVCPAVPVQAAGAPNLLVSSASGQPGDTVSITITLENPLTVSGVEYVINYDKDTFFVEDKLDSDYDGVPDGVHFNLTPPNFPTNEVTVKNNLGQVSVAQARTGGGRLSS